jgi:hypothetical protein
MVSTRSSKARRWCAVGALNWVDGTTHRLQERAYDYLREAAEATEGIGQGLTISVGMYNDKPGRIHEQILALYDEAMRLAEAAA